MTRKLPLTPTMEIQRAIKARDWAWAEEVATERMNGAHALRWLRKLERLQMVERAGLRVCQKAGPLRNGNELGGGGIWHAVPGDPVVSQAALCGEAPSIMWSDWRPEGQRVTCQRCLRLAELLPVPANQ